MKLDINLLPVLLAVVDEGSGSAAARRLNMSQPAVSAALAKLRESLGDQLFVRTARGLDPTPRTLAVVEPIRAALALVNDEVMQDIRFNPGTSNRTITLALSDIGEMVFLPRLLERLGREATGMSVHSVTLPPVQTARGLEVGEIDLALGYFPDLKGSNFYQQRLFSHGFTCLLRKGHPLTGPRLTSLQFAELGHAVVRAEGRSQEVFERFLLKEGIHRRVVLNTPHFVSLPSIIAKSDLVATVPLAVGTAFSEVTQIRLVQPPIATPRFDLKQHWHRRVQNDPVSKWLRAMIYELFNESSDEWRESRT